MADKTYTIDDVTHGIKSHAEYAQVKGTFELSLNINPLTKTLEQVEFKCSEEHFNNFIDDIVKELNVLSEMKTDMAPKEWAPFPGIRKEEMINRYIETPEVYKEMIQENPHIVIITKTSDEGQVFSWKFP